MNKTEPPRVSAGRASWVDGYQFVDYATQAYVLAVALLILLFHGEAVSCRPWLLGAHAGTMALVHWLVRREARNQPGGVLGFLRHLYPVLLYTGFYQETGLLNQMFVTGYLDWWFIRWEEVLFGGQPSLSFMAAWPHVVISELFYAAYFSYYVMIAGVGVALFIRDRGQFFHYISVISFVFYVCYFCYIFLPVMGPRIFFSEAADQAVGADMMPDEAVAYPASVQAGPFYQVMAVIYRIFAAPGAAFPSSHVAVALGTLCFSFRYLRPVRWAHLAAVCLLCLSTVYCRYHYVVDVLAGMATAAVLIPLANRLHRRFLDARKRVNSAPEGA